MNTEMKCRAYWVRLDVCVDAAVLRGMQAQSVAPVFSAFSLDNRAGM